MFRNPVLLIALALTVSVAGWGIVDNQGLAAFAAREVEIMFTSRGWFVMLTASIMLLVCLWLAFSRHGAIKLGKQDEEPEFSTISWLTMMFAAGMGVGLLFYGSAEPLSHFLFIKSNEPPAIAASYAMLLTYFHWGLHAWAIYGFTALVLAYFSFRRNTSQLVSAPIINIFGVNRWTRAAGGLVDILSIYAIAIGLAGSVAMGVFQVQDGVAMLFALDTSLGLALGVFAILCVSFIVPLTMDLSKGMATLSNIALLIAVGLMVFLILCGPTSSLMNGIVEGIGSYLTKVVPLGFMTYTFFGEEVRGWFSAWTLNYMVWWLAWSPFVGVFIARISRGRTIREFLLGVLLVPTCFSILWFGVFGGVGFYESAAGRLDPTIVQTNINQTSFLVLDNFPLSSLTIAATVVAAFLFIVTSVVSAAFVLSMFSTRGNPDPSVKIKLIWGVILGALGLVMILSDSVDAVRQIIAISASPFVFIVLLLMVCFLKALKKEQE
ncbi:MAG: BCCT family transporter [Desulfofustis sp. PB-SRB1]|jgi:glycine betaine transporter|nr:BCCT family transporter [Desulfofustis sp. PB-SRB1]MBM1001071.1 BCCT family transporter [Desulfofustis sp. PB-SRB1]HBH28304.1 BCCT family transporter [Desulfofustis sp.]